MSIFLVTTSPTIESSFFEDFIVVNEELDMENAFCKKVSVKKPLLLKDFVMVEEGGDLQPAVFQKALVKEPLIQDFAKGAEADICEEAPFGKLIVDDLKRLPLESPPRMVHFLRDRLIETQKHSEVLTLLREYERQIENFIKTNVIRDPGAYENALRLVNSTYCIVGKIENPEKDLEFLGEKNQELFREIIWILEGRNYLDSILKQTTYYLHDRPQSWSRRNKEFGPLREKIYENVADEMYEFLIKSKGIRKNHIDLFWSEEWMPLFLRTLNARHEKDLKKFKDVLKIWERSDMRSLTDLIGPGSKRLGDWVSTNPQHAMAVLNRVEELASEYPSGEEGVLFMEHDIYNLENINGFIRSSEEISEKVKSLIAILNTKKEEAKQQIIDDAITKKEEEKQQITDDAIFRGGIYIFSTVLSLGIIGFLTHNFLKKNPKKQSTSKKRKSYHS